MNLLRTTSAGAHDWDLDSHASADLAETSVRLTGPVMVVDDDGREVARVPCRPEELQKKTEISEFRSVPRPDGIHALSAVRIKGETIAHRVVTN